MRCTTKKKLITAAALAGAVCLLPGLAAAQVRGICSDCHTMHNSQDGAPMNAGATVYGALTRGDCIGCHTNTSGTAGRGGSSNNIPFVNHTSEPSLGGGGYLAGGSFYWVGTGAADAKGHNVLGIAGVDGTLGNTPPGYNSGTDGHNYNDLNRLTCAGTNGCHGDRSQVGDYAGLAGAHHGTQPDGAYTAGATLASSYRFLNGVKGIESADWEALQQASSRNVYAGVARDGDGTNTTTTISSLCGQCHGNFHSGASNISEGNDMSSPWVRHPTDFDMFTLAGGSEYRAYQYNMLAPVAAKVSELGAAYERPTGVLVAKEAIVTCISCHRAHGTPYNDLLRWNYASMLAHEAAGPVQNTGCFACHTTKDS